MKIKDCTIIGTVSCNEDDKIADIAKAFKENKVRHIIVVDENDSPIGIVSTVDVVNEVVAEGKDPKETTAGEIMTKPITTIDINEDLKNAYIEMINKSIYSCPIVEDGKLKGMLTFNEALKHMVQMKKQG